MQDVYEAVYQKPSLEAAKLDELTEKQRDERFDSTEYLRRVELEARKANAYLPRTERRAEVRAAVKRAKKLLKARVKETA